MTRLLLRAASWIVPRERRSGWLDEWRAELWHVRMVDRPRAFGFSCGAFRDALWLRRHDRSPRMPLLASPVHCLAVLALLAGVGFALRPIGRVSDEVLALRPHGGRFTLTFDEYRSIAEHLPSGFTIAFYRPGKHGPALATPGMADVLRGSRLPNRQTYVTVEDPGHGAGYVLARAAVRPPSTPWHVRIPRTDGRVLLLDCGPAEPRIPLAPFLVIMAAALTVLAGTTSFSLGAMPRWAWLFLVVKLALAPTVVWFAAWLLPVAVMTQALLVGWVLAVRWAFHDQRRRCPVCLRRVTNPVSFGCLSHTLLDWHGSEFVCPEGHGLLQISATFASPYAAQQWVRL